MPGGPLVRGCLLASYITFDLSPELALNQPAKVSDVPAAIVNKRAHASPRRESRLDDAAFGALARDGLAFVAEDERRDEKYARRAPRLFRRVVASISASFHRRAAGLTTPETTAVMLRAVRGARHAGQLVAPAFGFQKNMRNPDNAALARSSRSSGRCVKKLA